MSVLALRGDRTPAIGRRPGVDPVAAVATLGTVRLGGAEQWVLERTEDRRNPIVLFLHGGPGTSQLTLNRRTTRDLERCFTVVNWDQRGAGKSFACGGDSGRMTVDQFVQDTTELVEYLLEKYDQDRLVLVGHSWGTVVGAITAARHPELLHAYVGIGQIANMRDGEGVSYAWTLDQARRRGARRAVDALVEMGPPPYTGDWQKKTIKQRSLLARLGGEVHGSNRGAMGMVLSGLVVSREYTLVDRVNVFRGIFRSMKLLWPELLTVDLFESVPELDVPVFFMEGRHDHEVPAALAAAYFDVLRAPSKQLIWFEHSGHLPNMEERDRFTAVMVDEVLPLASPAP